MSTEGTVVRDERRAETRFEEQREREKELDGFSGAPGRVLRQERQRWERFAGPGKAGDIPHTVHLAIVEGREVVDNS